MLIVRSVNSKKKKTKKKRLVGYDIFYGVSCIAAAIFVSLYTAPLIQSRSVIL